ncbi:phosphopantothenate/pantothenate synthetase [Halobacteriales archaeon QS_9_68_17]|nr:MAG: phosphopantothenate/pantothenate synthetase [Halobacteriales archaeon QS_9_68_17]
MSDNEHRRASDGSAPGHADGNRDSADDPDGDGTEGAVPAEVTEESEIPENHPRYQDLVSRHRIEEGVEKGITHLQGMHAEGRGSAFDYLLGEETIPSADEAERAAAARLLLADRPVLSVNGNVAALAPEEMVDLAEAVDADLEVNLFNRTDERVEAVADHLREHGADEVKGPSADARLPGLDHERGKVDADGIYAADVVLVPLEDGDRAEALGEMGKTEIVIDLNPLSRSPQVAAIPVVDDLLRAVPNVASHARDLADADEAERRRIVDEFDADAALAAAERRIRTGDY